MFTGVDFITILLVLSGVLLGAIRGFLGTVIDLFSIAVGLALASVVYRAPVHLFRRFQITGSALELTLFILTSIILTMTVVLLLEIWRKRIETKLAVDRIFGGLLGIVEGFIFASGVLIAMSSSYDAGQEIQASRAARYVIRFIPEVYERAERHGITLPKVIVLPSIYTNELKANNQSFRFEKLNFVKLEGSTCLKCGGKVLFEGYFPRNGAGMAPKFVCSQCKRTSDGCQTFEGFHVLYGACPVDLAGKGQWFDCGNWPNHEWIIPRETCPVDNKRIESWEWSPPVSYR